MKYLTIMSDKQMDRLDAFTRKVVREIPLEKPSKDFSKNVMAEIYALEKRRVSQQYEPLISKKVWLLLLVFFIVMFLWVFNNSEGEATSTFSWVDLSSFTELISFDFLLNFKVSDVTVYAFVFMAIMVSVQIGYIKNYYNSRFN